MVYRMLKLALDPIGGLGVLTFPGNLHETQNVLLNVTWRKENGETVGVTRKMINLSGELRVKSAIRKIRSGHLSLKKRNVLELKPISDGFPRWKNVQKNVCGVQCLFTAQMTLVPTNAVTTNGASVIVKQLLQLSTLVIKLITVDIDFINTKLQIMCVLETIKKVANALQQVQNV